MATIVNRRFQEWTRGLKRQQALIAVFEHIRDIPYSLSVPPADPGEAQELILVYQKGSCGPKHRLFAGMAFRLGYEVTYVRVPFLWNHIGVSYPPDLTRLAEDLPVAHHLACRVRVDDRWLLVDATWDLPLGRAGFPVNENWDGVSDTRCAVRKLPPGPGVMSGRSGDGQESPRQDAGTSRPGGRRDRERNGGRAAGSRGSDNLTMTQYFEMIRCFHREFDSWLERIRTG